MLRRHSNRPLSRLPSALMAVCYVVLSLTLPFQHHHGVEDARAPVRIASPSEVARAQMTRHTRAVANGVRADSERCFACEWQAANLSVALPAYGLALERPASPPVVAALRHCCGSRSFGISSRGPPLA